MNNNKTRNQNQNLKQDKEQKAEKCPRCESTNTKFCYYNNYSKSQPRYLCKACKRHWTQGGTLRNVPVGGARKNKRLKTSSPSATAIASASAMPADQPHNVSAPTSPAIDPSILPQNTGLQYPFPGSSSSSLDSLQSSGVYDCVKETMMDEFPWRMEGSRSYSWNWDEVDALVSTTELSVPWDIDDSEIKIKP